jgi:hypothetical protein
MKAFGLVEPMFRYGLDLLRFLGPVAGNIAKLILIEEI